MTPQTSEDNKPLTYGSPAEAVHDFDAHTLMRSREKVRRSFERLIVSLSGPELRDLDQFYETVEEARERVETPEDTPIRDFLAVAMQMWLGILSSEGLRYMEIIALDDAVTPEHAKREGAGDWWNRFDKAEREGYSYWPDKYRKAVIDFAPYLQIARIVYRRCEALVKRSEFPEPFRLALEESIGKKGDPDNLDIDYGEQALIKAGLLHSKTGARTQVKPPKQQAADKTNSDGQKA